MQVKHKTLIIWGEEDQIISNKLAVVSTTLRVFSGNKLKQEYSQIPLLLYSKTCLRRNKLMQFIKKLACRLL